MEFWQNEVDSESLHIGGWGRERPQQAVLNALCYLQAPHPVSHHTYTNNKEVTQLSFYITCWMMFTFLASAIRFISFLTLSMSTPLFLLLQPKCSSFLNTIPKSNIHVHLDVWNCSIWVNITQIQCSYTQALEHQ